MNNVINMMNVIYIGINVILIKNMKLFQDPNYKYCHKIIPFIRPFNTSLLNFYSTISSYLYHQDIYDQNDRSINENITQSQILTPQEMVHSIVNSIVSISSIEPCYYKYSIPIHLCKYVGLNEVVPISVDLLFYNSSYILIYIFVLVTYMKPFHNMNPFVTHILLMIMRYSR